MEVWYTDRVWKYWPDTSEYISMSNACNTRCYTIPTYITYTPSCYKSILQFHLYWNCQVHEIYSRVSGSMFPYYRNSRSII